jgi:dynein assembly factor 3
LPHIHQREYKDWRENGVAHEVRLGSNAIPNRTLSSYMPGQDKKSKDKIMVRGYWGDIIQSPYVALGTEIWEEPENTRFFKKINYQMIYSSQDVSCYQIHSQIHRLQHLEKYEFPFERLNHIEGRKEKSAE